MQNSYIDDIIVSRRLMNNMVNLMNHQERNIRIIINQRNNRSNPINQYSYFVNGNDMYSAQRSNIAPISQPVAGRQRSVSRQPEVTRQVSNTRQPTLDSNTRLHFNNLFTPTRGISRNRRSAIPSALEINTATISTTFSNIERPQNTTCPITRESFNANDNVTQIIQCGHTFNTNNLYEWFNHSSVCPMCRYDIRSHTNASLSTTTRTTSGAATGAVTGAVTGAATGAANGVRVASVNNQVAEYNENSMTDLTNIAEQIANDILTNITDTNITEGPNISLEYSLYTPIENNSTTTHRTSIDPSLNIE